MSTTRIKLGDRTFARREVVDALKASRRRKGERKGEPLPFDHLPEDTRPQSQRSAAGRYSEPTLFDGG